jgi:hypothetical protein
VQRLIEGVHRFHQEQFGQNRARLITRSGSCVLARLADESRAKKVKIGAEKSACGKT